MELTDKEEKFLESLKKLCKKWPKNLWLFAGDGTFVTILKYGEDGQMMDKTGSVDQDYIVDTVKIPNDGGDW